MRLDKIRRRLGAIAAIAVFGALALIPMVMAQAPDSSVMSKMKEVGRRRPNRPDIKPTVPLADRNVTDKVFFEHADTLRFRRQEVDPVTGREPDQYQVLVGNVKFRKGGMVMYCDSAYFYEESNSFDAFGHIKMEQGDTLFVYGDELNYEGENEIAVIYAFPGKQVKLINRDVMLETEIFNYNMAEEVGYYEVGGTLSDKQNRLTSREGEYYPSTKYAYFYRSVELVGPRDNGDTLRMFTDTLVYNTETHIAEIVDLTNIYSADGHIISRSGTYNTDIGLADLYRRSTVKTSDGNTLTGDTLMYDREAGYGEAYGNAVMVDSARQTSVSGDFGFYNELTDSVFVTGRALAKEYSSGDTLYMHGDTIESYIDPVDSARVMNVYHKVRFYRVDMQGLCDSLSYDRSDSVIYMYRNPVVWSDTRQIFGNTIMLHLNDSVLDWARLPDFGFVAEHLDEDCYNQLSGSDITAWFEDSKLHRLYVDGSLQMIMFPMENDSTYNKFAFIESSYLDAYFEDNALTQGRIWPENNGNVTPLFLAKRSSYFLPKFAWYEEIRPMAPGDVFIRPDKMLALIAAAPPVTPRVKVRRGDAEVNPDAPDEIVSDTVAGGSPDGAVTPADQLLDFIHSILAIPADDGETLTSQPAEEMSEGKLTEEEETEDELSEDQPDEASSL